MTPAERAAKIAELRADADRLEREGKRNWPETVEIGMIFQHNDGEVYIASRAAEDALTRYQSPDCLVCVSGEYPGFGVMYAEPNDCSPFDGDESDFIYLGHARDLLAIKTPDAHEPTGAELVGRLCEFSPDGKEWVVIGRCAKYCRLDEREPFCFFCDQSGPRHGYWSFARLYRGRP